MAIAIGAKYDAKRAMLAGKIHNGNLSALEAEAGAHACYFCNTKITGPMVVLIEECQDTSMSSHYFLDPVCYRKANSHRWHDTLQFSSN